MRWLFHLALVASAGCVGFQSSVGYSELVDQYEAQFSAEGDTLKVSVLNPGGLNIVRLHAFPRDGCLYLGAARASSGPMERRVFSLHVSPYELGTSWDEQVYWVGPSGCATRLNVMRQEPP